jgi:predicted permease
MATGIITASLTNTLQYLPPFDNTLDESTCLNATIICIAVCLFLYLASFYFPREDSHRKIYICLIELLSGIIFAVGNLI